MFAPNWRACAVTGRRPASRRRVVLSRRAIGQLRAIDNYLAGELSDYRAAQFVDGIVGRCDALATFPFRGTPRDDLRPGIRTTVYRRKVVIAYSIEAVTVTILGVFYGGQDFETDLRVALETDE